ncbi:MAG: hypothetical protein LBM92_05440, partial [Opitutaceae bacterium]|nr:hypothetical protein [Opitutaceae bacterium]
MIFRVAVAMFFVAGWQNTQAQPAGGGTAAPVAKGAAEVPGAPVKGKYKIPAKALGIWTHRVAVSNPKIAMAAPFDGGVMIEAAASGHVTLAASDAFGHTAAVDAVISAKGKFTVKVTKNTGGFIDAQLHHGAKGDGVADDTAAIQDALDAAKPGGTVYLGPGIYKASILVMREGVTLEMFTTMTDAKKGFTSELAVAARSGAITVLSGPRIRNNGHNLPGRDGSSHFTIRGGLIDVLNAGRAPLILGTADGVLVENVIFKDIKGNHVIQVTGCSNTTIRNCMFAGYTVGDVFTREMVQVEVSTPGATGAPPNAPLTYDAGEFNFSKNIEISGCYFGKSDKCGAPLIAIGHHSRNGAATVTGFRIVNNVFDEVLYSAIRYCNIVDTQISGNTFVSTSKHMNTTAFPGKAVTPAFIIIYMAEGVTKYPNIVNGATVTKALEAENSGTRNLLIKNNTFNIGAGSDKKIIHASGSGLTEGLAFSASLLRQDQYDKNPYSFSGYTANSNVISGLALEDNAINMGGQPAYADCFMFLSRVNNLKIANNTCRLRAAFSATTGGVPGIYTSDCKSGADAARR